MQQNLLFTGLAGDESVSEKILSCPVVIKSGENDSYICARLQYHCRNYITLTYR